MVVKVTIMLSYRSILFVSLRSIRSLKKLKSNFYEQTSNLFPSILDKVDAVARTLATKVQ